MQGAGDVDEATREGVTTGEGMIKDHLPLSSPSAPTCIAVKTALLSSALT